jgi:hypothetical protein
MEVKLPSPQHPVDLIEEKFGEKIRTRKELEEIISELQTKLESAYKKLETNEFTLVDYDISFEQQTRIGCGPCGGFVLSEKMGRFFSLPNFKQRTQDYLQEVKIEHNPSHPISGYAYVTAFRDHGYEAIQAKDPTEPI